MIFFSRRVISALLCYQAKSTTQWRTLRTADADQRLDGVQRRRVQSIGAVDVALFAFDVAEIALQRSETHCSRRCATSLIVECQRQSIVRVDVLTETLGDASDGAQRFNAKNRAAAKSFGKRQSGICMCTCI